MPHVLRVSLRGAQIYRLMCFPIIFLCFPRHTYTFHVRTRNICSILCIVRVFVLLLQHAAAVHATAEHCIQMSQACRSSVDFTSNSPLASHSLSKAIDVHLIPVRRMIWILILACLPRHRGCALLNKLLNTEKITVASVCAPAELLNEARLCVQCVHARGSSP
jgi:hypothetical protein